MKALVGRGLTDHPTTNEITTFVTTSATSAPDGRSREDRLLFARAADANNEIRYPFNVEMNINHEYWHLRENDPARSVPAVSADTATACRGSTSSSASGTVWTRTTK